MNIFLVDINKNLALHRFILIIVFIIGIVFLLSLETMARPLTKDGIHFQKWSSDKMNQALNSEGLRKHPIKSLWYLHKEPPLYDMIRAVMVNFSLFSGRNLLDRLDKEIYLMWAIIFGLMAALIYQWLSQLASARFAFYSSMLWIMHPASIYYATYLDPTILVSFGILYFFYELWKIYKKSGSITRLSISAILLFYIRASFPWYFFFLLAFSLWLMKVPRKDLVKFIVICVLAVSPYVMKQYVLFKTTGSTLIGQNYFFLVAGNDPLVKELRATAAKIPATYPKEAVLSVGGHNTEYYWRQNQAYFELADRYLKSHPWASVQNIWRAFAVFNWPSYWRPSATFLQEKNDFYRWDARKDLAAQTNVVVSILPWDKIFNQYLSYPIDFFLLVMAFLIYGKSRWDLKMPILDRCTGAIFLPVFYIFLTSTLISGDGKGWTEAVRYKFFLEPLFYVFIASQVYFLIAVKGRKINVI